MSLLAASAYLKSRRLASSRNLIRDNLGQRAGRASLPTLAWAHTPRGRGRLAWRGAYLMGMSFMISRNMEGDTTGSQLLGNRGSEPLSTTLRSSIQRLKDSRGGSMPVGQDTVSKSGFRQQAPRGSTGGVVWALEVPVNKGPPPLCQELSPRQQLPKCVLRTASS